MKIKSRNVDGKMSRSAFIRSQPKSMPVDEVVAAGKKEGYDIDPKLVHQVRYQVKAHEKIHGKPKKKVKPKTARVLKANGAKKGRRPFGPDDAISALDDALWALRATYGTLKQTIRDEVRLEMQRIMGAVNA